MVLSTIGHACLVLKDENNAPLLITDPWLLGSCYWRSWWLQSYPTKDEMEYLTNVKYCYITHEHPDHYHLPTIRKIGNKPTFLSPHLPHDNIDHYLAGMGLKTKNLTPMQWYNLNEDVQILSIPLFNDDSTLIINTKNAIIINLNDSKPFQNQLDTISSYIQKEAANKKVVVLSSYSPASIVNSFRKGSEFVSFKDKKDYVLYINNVVNTLGADYFIPFASQVIFYRPDSTWANEYKVTLDDLKKYWNTTKTTLLPPYSTLDLNTFAHSFIPKEKYNHDSQPILEKVGQQVSLEAEATFTEEDKLNLTNKMRGNRLFLAPLFRKGIGFITEKVAYTFYPISGKLVEGLDEKVHFSIKLPTQALKDAITYGHFGDLGITMFTLLILNRGTHPRMIYLFFMILTFHDYKHTISIGNFMRWFKAAFKVRKWNLPKLSTVQNM